MGTLLEEKPPADLRDSLAEERTFLAWIRTGLSLMGFGFVVAHFGISPDGLSNAQHAAGFPPHEPSLWFGMVLIAVGIAVNLFSARRHVRLARELRRAHVLRRYLSEQGVIVALILALLGIAMAIYMILIYAQPLRTLRA